LGSTFMSGPKQVKKEKAMDSVLRKAGTIAGSAVILVACAGAGSSRPSTSDMTFFVTSVGLGKGGDLGGLEGADRHCQALAKAAGAGQHSWRAYLSTQATGLSDPNFVNARDRIGAGPWQNAQGVVIARNVEELHSEKNNVTKETALDERGQPVNGRTDKPTKHDMLTGSRPDGTAFPGPPFADMTCGNWTKSGTDGSAMTGHHDRGGPINASWAKSWNSSHPTRGCDAEGVRSTGGDALFYCFAEK
jgi:hypothetical protein